MNKLVTSYHSIKMGYGNILVGQGGENKKFGILAKNGHRVNCLYKLLIVLRTMQYTV